jgi:hypothetical protein
MPTYRVSKVPTSRRQQILLARVYLKSVKVDILYSPCTISRSLYMFSKASMKCLECVCYNVYYNRNFLSNDFNYLIIK